MENEGRYCSEGASQKRKGGVCGECVNVIGNLSAVVECSICAMLKRYYIRKKVIVIYIKKHHFFIPLS